MTHTEVPAPGTLRELSTAEAYALLREDSLGRVVYSDGALPAVTPVTYVLDGHAIVFRTATGSRLAHATENTVVAFEVDQIDRGTRSGWSVVVTGTASPCTDEPTLLRVTGLGLVPWVGGERAHLVRVVPGVVTGRILA